MSDRNSKAYAEGFLGVCLTEGLLEKPACVLLARAVTGDRKSITVESEALLKLAEDVRQLREQTIASK